MDLGGWNSDFDSSFLNCWDESGKTNSRSGGDSEEKPGRNRSLSSSRSSPRDDPSLWDGALNQWSQLSNFDYDASTSGKPKTSEAEAVSNDGSSQHMPTSAPQQQGPSVAPHGVAPSVTSHGVTPSGPPSVSDSSAAPQSVNAAQVSATTSVASLPGVGDAASTVTMATSNASNVAGLHPMAIQSSATCPPHGNASYSESSKPHAPAHQQTSTATQALPHALPQHLTQNLYGMATGLDTSTMASLAASLQQHSGNHPLNPETTQHLSSLAANFMMAQGSPAMPTQQVHGHAQNMQHGAPASAARPQVPQPAAAAAASPAPPAAVSPAPAPTSSTKHRKKDKSKNSAAASGGNASGNSVPPFYLFDAPIELRANFVQNQRRLGIPVQEDCNSYHYGETVKGFHPQNLLDAKHPAPAAALPPAPVQLVDARHGNPRQQMAGRVKNEREQKRAQKITELIEQLRLNMESGGWKVEMRSKFHTLSSCAEYVKHMIKTLKEKEDKMSKLKEELEVKRQKIAEDKSVQESRSDPESVMSSLTSSTGGSHCHKGEDNRKRKATDRDNDTDASTSNKKHCDVNSRNVSSYGTCEDSSGDDRGSGGSGGPFNDVSDITDSNRGSSSNSSGSGGSDDGPTVTRDSAEDEQQSGGSISSDAAVRSERSSHVTHGKRQHHFHKDVVFCDKKSPEHHHPKRKNEEINSLHSSFELDYEEVFDKSNIPQVIASTSGRVVTWNEMFMKATGLRKSEVERMTIFSLVQPDKLSSFFQIVAAALKDEDGQPIDALEAPDETMTDVTAAASEPEPAQEVGIKVEEDAAKGEGAPSDPIMAPGMPGFQRGQDYTAITLPCIDFPAMKKRRDKSEGQIDPKPLHVTVTLMDDDDPRKRCFHCVFTNCKGTDGTLGLITPELLAALFTEPDVKKSKSHHRHHHKSKRPRTREQETTRDEERLDGNKIDKIIPIPRKANNNNSSDDQVKEEDEEEGQQRQVSDLGASQESEVGDSSAEGAIIKDDGTSSQPVQESAEGVDV